MAGKKLVKGGAKATAAGSSLPKDQKDVDQSISGNSGAGDSNQSAMGSNENSGAADPGATAVTTANAGATTEADVARVAEEQRKAPEAQAEADRVAEEQRKADEVAALAAQKNQQKTEVPALLVSSRADRFRRCGFLFGKEPLGIALECLTDEQIELLKNEPNLIVEEVDALLDDLQVTEVQ